MNKDELYNLLSDKYSLSKQEIESAMKENSSFDTSNLDDFDREALEGWVESGETTANMSRVSNKLGFSGSKLNLMLSCIITILLLTAIFWPFLTSNNIAVKKIEENKLKRIEETDLYIAEKFDTLIQEQKTTKVEIQSLKKTQQAQPKIEITIEDNKPLFDIDELPVKAMPANSKYETINLETRKKIKEIYLHTFKLVDYRSIRSKPIIPTQQMDLSGTAANLEKPYKNEEEMKWKTVNVPYIDYINKSMQYMDKSSLKNALARFNIILTTYPDDINALFYAGFALYNLNEFDKARDKFFDVLQNGISNFDEEAMWYLALSYDKTGQSNKANDVFKTIASSESVYASLAKKKL
jgi:TolA-binding protein